MKNLIQYIDATLLKAITYAVFGGFARIYIRHKGKKLKLRTIFSGMLGASFVGCVLFEAIKYYDINEKAIGLLTLLSGFLHPEMIDYSTRLFMKKIMKSENENDTNEPK